MIPDPIDLARDLVRIDTANPPGNEEPAARLLGGLLTAAGFSVAYPAFAPGRTSLVAELAAPDMENCLCLSGHLDTVPVGEVAWRRPPLGGEIADGKLWGRGSADMKAGLAALVVAAMRVALAGGLSRGLRIVLTAGEETGLDGVKFLRTQSQLMGHAGAVLVTEPTDCRLLLGHKGVAWLAAEAVGRAAHGSMPEKGVNALYAAAEAALLLRGAFDGLPGHPVMGRPTISVNRMTAGSKLNIIPDHARMEIDCRTVPGMTGSGVLELVSRLTGHLVTFEPVDTHAPVWTDPAHPFARLATETAQATTGREHPPAAASYFTDGSVLAEIYPGAAVAFFGPGEPGACHTLDESCPLEHITLATETIGRMAESWLRN